MAIIVGDIHGDVEKARAFLEYEPAEEHVALGDYLDSFSESLESQVECLQLLMNSQAVLLLGNHECHYLKKALFRFAGFNYDHLRIFQDILEQNIQRFKAAYAVDGWLCTHAGLHRGLTAGVKNVDRLASLLNRSFERYLFGGEFPLVEIYGGRAYRIRENVFYLKRGEIFTIEGSTFLAFGGANSHDRFGSRTPSLSWGGGYEYLSPRIEGKDWWPEEIPSQEDFDNACRNLDTVGWKVDHVITHTCPLNYRPHFMKSSRVPDPTETILQQLYEKLTFQTWHFGHFHFEEQSGRLFCHYNNVRRLNDLVDIAVQER